MFFKKNFLLFQFFTELYSRIGASGKCFSCFFNIIQFCVGCSFSNKVCIDIVKVFEKRTVFKIPRGFCGIGFCCLEAEEQRLKEEEEKRIQAEKEVRDGRLGKLFSCFFNIFQFCVGCSFSSKV